MSSSRVTDVELVLFHFIRNHYEAKYNNFVPMALKYLTLKFSNRIIGYKSLTIKQDMEFFNLLSTKLSQIRRFNLLFRASEHEYSASKFHEYCDNKPGTITIIKNNHGHIFGGYTSKSWTSQNRDIKDENAFLFLIRSDDKSIKHKCPLLFEVDKNRRKNNIKRAICCIAKHGPVFGSGRDIFIRDQCDRSSLNCSKKRGYIYPPEINSICGGNIASHTTNGENYFKVIDYEVFQII